MRCKRQGRVELVQVLQAPGVIFPEARSHGSTDPSSRLRSSAHGLPANTNIRVERTCVLFVFKRIGGAALAGLGSLRLPSDLAAVPSSGEMRALTTMRRQIEHGSGVTGAVSKAMMWLKACSLHPAVDGHSAACTQPLVMQSSTDRRASSCENAHFPWKLRANMPIPMAETCAWTRLRGGQGQAVSLEDVFVAV